MSRFEIRIRSVKGRSGPSRRYGTAGLAAGPVLIYSDFVPFPFASLAISSTMCLTSIIVIDTIVKCSTKRKSEDEIMCLLAKILQLIRRSFAS